MSTTIHGYNVLNKKYCENCLYNYITYLLNHMLNQALIVLESSSQFSGCGPTILEQAYIT